MSKREVEAIRIRDGKCPKCGADMKDKGSYIRCTKCQFSITNGGWSESDGFAYQIVDEGTDERKGRK